MIEQRQFQVFISPIIKALVQYCAVYGNRSGNVKLVKCVFKREIN